MNFLQNKNSKFILESLKVIKCFCLLIKEFSFIIDWIDTAMMNGSDKRMLEREALRNMIQQWNMNRLDLFELSEPKEVLFCCLEL